MPIPTPGNGPDLRNTQRVVGLAVVLSIAGFAALVVAALNQQPTPPPPTVDVPSPPTKPTPTRPTTRAGGMIELERSVPVRIRIPNPDLPAATPSRSSVTPRSGGQRG